jgi:hypothetical protein
LKKAFLIFEIITLVAIVLAALVDLAFFLFGGSGQTLSYQFWALSKQYPIIPYLFGFLSGHLLWQYNPDYIKPS